MSHTHASMTTSTQTSAGMDAWLQGFATKKQAACRAYLCTRYYLNALDAEALINSALLQVVHHWATIDNPLAYLWQTLKHAVAKQGRRRAYERQQLAVYAQQRRLQAHSVTRTAVHMAAVLARVAPRQRQILAWYAQGHADVQVAAWLHTTPEAVRVARHGAYRALRAQLCPAAHLSQDVSGPNARPQARKHFLGTPNILPSSRPL